MVDTLPGVRRQTPTIYDRIGVRTIINAAGATTAVGGTLMPPEVIEAMIDASRGFVVIDEMNRAIGEKIAEVTGAQAGMVTAGSAASMLVSVAACIAGVDPAKIRKLPHSEGMANEVIIHRAHRIHYDQMFQAAGGRLVEIGIVRGTYRWELEDAISEKTACITYIDSPHVGPGALPFETVVEVARKSEIPVIVDAASTLPPKGHITRWIDRGADMVIYSGGKGIRGPQDTGLLAGRADLIEAARANGHPSSSVGRAAKVSKEAMAGLFVALERFQLHDHEQDHAYHLLQAEQIRETLEIRDDVRCELIGDPEIHPAPIVALFPADGATWNASALADALEAGEPSIHCKREHNGIQVHTHCLQPGDPEQIIESITAVLEFKSQR